MEETMSISVFTTTLLAVTLLHSASCSPRSISNEVQQLQQLECEPKLAAVNVVDHLGKVNELADKEFFPQVVAINRCLPECSFCGYPRRGVSNEPCLPDEDAIEQRKIVAFYFDGGEKKFSEVNVPEHTDCKCPH